MRVSTGGTYTSYDTDGHQQFHKFYVELEEEDWLKLVYDNQLGDNGTKAPLHMKFMLMSTYAHVLLSAEMASKGVASAEFVAGEQAKFRAALEKVRAG